MTKWKIQHRFVSPPRHTSEWQTIAQSATESGAKRLLDMFNADRPKDIEYRMVRA
jgi:hypothetical protein